MVCDLTIAADNAVFGQTGPKVKVHQSSVISVYHSLMFYHEAPKVFTPYNWPVYSFLVKVGSFDAGYGSSIMARLVR